MTEMSQPHGKAFGDYLKRHSVKIVGLGLLSAPLLIQGAMAATFNLSAIGDIIDGFVGILPKFLDLIIGAAPVIIGMAIVSAIVAFPDKILGMMKWK